MDRNIIFAMVEHHDITGVLGAMVGLVADCVVAIKLARR